MAQLIVALDLPRKDAALSLARDLQGLAPWCKVGMELFTLAGALPAGIAQGPGLPDFS